MARKLLFGFVTILAVALLVWGCSDDEVTGPTDDTPPVISNVQTNFYSPARQGDLLCEPLEITGTATDEASNIDKVVLYVDGVEVAVDEPGTSDSAYDFTFTGIDPIAAALGVEITIDAFDTAGNHGDADNPVFTVDVWNDETAPVVAITPPEGDQLFCSGDELLVEVVEANTLASLVLFVDADSVSCDYTDLGENTYSFVVDAAWFDGDGDYTIGAAATDQCGNVGNDELTDIAYSCPEPVVAIIAPIENHDISGSFIFTASVTFDTRELPDVERVEFYFDSETAPFGIDYEGPEWTFQYDPCAAQMPEGGHNVHAVAYLSDEASYNSAAVPFIVDCFADILVTVTTPAPDELLCGPVDFTATVEFLPPTRSEDPKAAIAQRDITVDKVQFFFAGDETYFGEDTSEAGGWSVAYDITDMEGGELRIYAKAYLSNGQTDLSSLVDFIKTCAPVPFFGPYTVLDPEEWIVRIDAHESWDDNHEQQAPLDFMWTCPTDPAATVYTTGGLELEQGVWYEGDSYNMVDFDFTLGYGDYQVCVDVRDIYDIVGSGCQDIFIEDVIGPDIWFTAPAVDSVIGDHNVPVALAVSGSDRDNWFPAIAQVAFSYDQVNGGATGEICTDADGAAWTCNFEGEDLPATGDYYDLLALPTDNSGNNGPMATRRIYKSDLPVITGITRHIGGQPDRGFAVGEHAWANELEPNFSLNYTDDNVWGGNPTPSSYLVEWDLEYSGSFSVDETGENVWLDYYDEWCVDYTLAVRVRETTDTGYQLPYVMQTWTLTMENDAPVITDFDVVDFEGYPGTHLVSGTADVIHAAEDWMGWACYSDLDFGTLTYYGWANGEFGDFSHTSSPYVWQIDGVEPFDYEPYCGENWVDSAAGWEIYYRIYDVAGNWTQASDEVVKSDLPCVTLPDITYTNDCAPYDYVNGGIPVAFDGWSIVDDNGVAEFGYGWSFSGPFTGLGDPNWVDADELPEESIENMPELPWVWHFPEYGFYSARLIGTDATGRIAWSDPVVVEISDCTAPDAVEIKATPDEFQLTTEICVIGPIIDRDSGPEVDYITFYAAGTVIETLYADDEWEHGWCFIWNTAGWDCQEYYLWATVTDVNGNTSAGGVNQILVTKLGGPPYGTEFGSDRYAGETNPSDITFTVTAYDDCDQIDFYHWDFDDNGVIDETTTLPTATNTYAIGMYDCRVTVENSAGFTDEAVCRVSIADTTNPVVNSLEADDGEPMDLALDIEGWGAQYGANMDYIVDAIDEHDGDAGILDMLELVIEDGGSFSETLSWTNPDPWDNAVVHGFDFDWDGMDSGPYSMTAIAYDFTVPPPNMSFPLVTINVYKSDPPHAEIDPEPVNGDWTDETSLQLSFSAFASHDDENGGAGGAIDLYRWDFNGDGSYDLDTTDPDPVDWDYFASGDGYGGYWVTLLVRDNTDLERTTSVYVEIEDVTTPDVLFLVPRPGDVLTGLEPFEVDPAGTYDRGTMPEVEKVEYYVGGVKMGESWTQPNFPVDIDFTGYPGGLVEIEARAYDLGGLTGSDTFIVYKSDAPVVNLPGDYGVFQPSPYQAVVDFGPYISDDNEHIYIWVDWDDGTGTEYLGEDVFAATHAYASEGVYTIGVTVEDEYTGDGTTPGNIGEGAFDTSDIYIDNTPPTMGWVGPPDGTTCISSPLGLMVDGIADNYGDGNLDRVDFYVSIDGGGYTLVGTDNSIIGGEAFYMWSYDPMIYPAGTEFCFGARVWDLAQPNGNSYEVGFDGSICVTKNDVPWDLAFWTNVSGGPEAWVLFGTDVTYQGSFSNDGDLISNYYWDWGCVMPWEEDNPDNIPVIIHTEDYGVGDLCVQYAIEDECGISSTDNELHIYGDDPPDITDFLPADLSDEGGTEIEFSFDVSDIWYWTDGTFEVVDVTGIPTVLLSQVFVSNYPNPVNDAAPPEVLEGFDYMLSTECLAAGTILEATVWVQDTEGNTAQVTHTINIVDGEGPFMAPEDWITPQQGDELNADEQSVIDIVVNPSDWHCTEIDYVEFYIDDYGWPMPADPPFDIAWDPEVGGQYDGYFMTTFNINGWEDGDHRIGVLVWDTEGKMSVYETIGVTKVGAK